VRAGTLTAMLLVGGKSRRMGTDKATLMMAFERLWQRQLGVLRELEPETLWISARFRPDWCPGEIEVVRDVPPSRGPLSGIAAALARLQTSHLLAMAIDMPQMTAAHIRKLLSCARPGCGVVPINENWFEPLCALYPAEASDVALHSLAQGQLSLQEFARSLSQRNWIKHYQVLDSEKHLYLNLNEPAPDSLRNSIPGSKP
jgi:molybdopterin-guanine dinucleotide biosynthesis protein A